MPAIAIGTLRPPGTTWASAVRRTRALLAFAVLVLFVASCGGGADTPPLGPVADADMSLTANNQSDRALELYVNESKIADIGATSQLTIQAKDLPPLPWDAQLRLPTGRTLLSLTITSGSVVRRENGVQSAGTRVDLSCGRIELYAVTPLGGPAPGSGHPGDCGP